MNKASLQGARCKGWDEIHQFARFVASEIGETVCAPYRFWKSVAELRMTEPRIGRSGRAKADNRKKETLLHTLVFRRGRVMAV